LLFEPGDITAQFRDGKLVGGVKLRAQSLILEILERFKKVLGQKIGRALGNLDRRFDERPWQGIVEIRASGGENFRSLSKHRNDGTNPVRKGGKVTFDVNQHFDSAG